MDIVIPDRENIVSPGVVRILEIKIKIRKTKKYFIWWRPCIGLIPIFNIIETSIMNNTARAGNNAFNTAMLTRDIITSLYLVSRLWKTEFPCL